jgi:hypothetical protein
MFLREYHRWKDCKYQRYAALVESVRTATGPRHRPLCYLGEPNSSLEARWRKAIEVFNAQEEQHKL